MKNQKTIIIKKVKKHHGGGHHGGSWKVAYADFVTAMMAFFLLLWLITMTSPEKRARISNYFKYFSLFSQGGISFMQSSSEMFSESGETSQKVFRDMQNKNTVDSENMEKPDSTYYATGASSIDKLKNALKKDIVEKLGDIKDQVLVDTVEGGVRIQIIDKDGSLMFPLGSNKLTPKAKEILRVLGENINNLSNKVIIEGHTDALPYARSDYSNWELSTERASSARKELEANGLNPNRISRVAGYAATDPLIKDNPADPRNRRISIIVQVPPNIDKGALTKGAHDLVISTDGEDTGMNNPETESIIDMEPVPEKKDSTNLNASQDNESLNVNAPAAKQQSKKSGIKNKSPKTPAEKVEDSDASTWENSNNNTVIKELTKEDWLPVKTKD